MLATPVARVLADLVVTPDRAVTGLAAGLLPRRMMGESSAANAADATLARLAWLMAAITEPTLLRRRPRAAATVAPATLSVCGDGEGVAPATDATLPRRRVVAAAAATDAMDTALPRRGAAVDDTLARRATAMAMDAALPRRATLNASNAALPRRCLGFGELPAPAMDATLPRRPFTGVSAAGGGAATLPLSRNTVLPWS